MFAQTSATGSARRVPPIQCPPRSFRFSSPNEPVLLFEEPLKGSPGSGGDGGGGRKSALSEEEAFQNQLTGDIEGRCHEIRELDRSMDPDKSERIGGLRTEIATVVATAVDAHRSWVNRLLFRLWAPKYDEFMQKTGHEEALRRIIHLFVGLGYFDPRGRKFSILDPSCGTAVPIQLLLRELGESGWNHLFFHITDLSPDMLAVGQQRLDKVLGASKLNQQVFFDTPINLEQRLPGSPFGMDRFDVAIFSQTLHLLSPAGRRNAYLNLIDSVKPGGRVLIVDEFPPKLSNGEGYLAQKTGAVDEIVHYLFKGMAGLDASKSTISTAGDLWKQLETGYPELVCEALFSVPIDPSHRMYGFGLVVSNTS
ncbi:MAG TPA: class I SAM-dependent methyltransferase [Candidatus Bilamarchaeaceae archaeon]|nr:class I SAM-dependent methyltransferase [Candidatus Bilamarchaeaceae archaeon]